MTNSEDYIFERCHHVNNLLQDGFQVEARAELIRLLDYHRKNRLSYTALINHLIRQTGLFPYMKVENADWSDRFAYEAFKVDVGESRPLTLHREQSAILRKLLDGKSLAVSAPTSFGKSFVVDSFISINQPRNVVIIVPTIALADETRRRLQKKFGTKYKIITTTDVELADRNIFVFPQERAFRYSATLKQLDILIIDEFYKASPDFDRERSPALLRAILKLGKLAKQRYFLAPNVKELNRSPFTEGMEFLPLDFNTVFLEKHDDYLEIGKDEQLKSQRLLSLIGENRKKSLVYAGTYTDIAKVSDLLASHVPVSNNHLLHGFASWLEENYSREWQLANLVNRGVGIHNGQLHRSLSQLQVKLFEEEDGLNTIISTSSIIEGVNTSAENVIIWRNQSGNAKLNDFTYKNIIGRGGRMFKHFVGKIYILEKPPEPTETQLNLGFADQIAGYVDEVEHKRDLTKEQIAKIVQYKEEMSGLLGVEAFSKLQQEGTLEITNADAVRKIAYEIKTNKEAWNGLGILNSSDPEKWQSYLYRIIKLSPSRIDAKHGSLVRFIKLITQNWEQNIPRILSQSNDAEISIDSFFKLERIVTFNLASLVHDINEIQKCVLSSRIDISPFVAKLATAFLPKIVYQLEEYGLPRMMAKKLHSAGIVNLEQQEVELHAVLEEFRRLNRKHVEKEVEFGEMESYIFGYFVDGLSPQGLGQ